MMGAVWLALGFLTLAAAALGVGLARGRFGARRGADELPVLVYHKVKPLAADSWTVAVSELDRQWSFLTTAGYRAISAAELVAHLNLGRSLPARPVMITFDDGYADNLAHGFPLLERHGLRATLFLPVRFIGGENEWDGGGERLLGYDELRALSPERIELGLHSYAHGNYRRMTVGQIAADLERCVAELRERGLPHVGVLAYPYGGDPLRRLVGRRRLRALFASLGIECGLRLGNRPNRLPLADRYAIRRIDIRREDTLETFCRKLAGKRG